MFGDYCGKAYRKGNYNLQFSLDCIEKLVKCLEKFNRGEIDADTSFKNKKHILTDEIDDPEFLAFAIENFSELFSYITSVKINIKIHKYMEGKR
ncbi:MAG: hypothetical protein ACE5GU_14065 [Candidatus Scalinduaceae bacterium]